MVLLAVGLLLMSDPTGFIAGLKDNPGVALGLAGTAYLIGVIYDRAADTLVGDIAGHHRSLFFLNNPGFAEDRLRIGILKNEQATQYAGYMRTRMRLTRAVATLTPALTVACVVFIRFQQLAAPPPILRDFAVLLLAVAYTLAFLSKFAKRPRLRGVKPERTEDIKLEDYQRNGDLVPLWRFILSDRAVWLACSLFSAGLVITLYEPEQRWLPVIPVAGLLLTALAGWSWLRITDTFFAFLRDYDRFQVPEAGK
jgi:hypothetical protein